MGNICNGSCLLVLNILFNKTCLVQDILCLQNSFEVPLTKTVPIFFTNVFCLKGKHKIYGKQIDCYVSILFLQN